MVDHAFLVYGKAALSLADEFYNLWLKNNGGTMEKRLNTMVM